MNLYAIPSLVALFANICLGIIIISNKTKTKSNQILLLLVIGVSVVTFGEFMQRNSQNATDAIFWAKFSFIGIIFLPSIFFHFTYFFPKIKDLKKHEIFSIYLPSFLFSGFLTNDLLIAGTYEHYFGYSAKFGKILPYFVAFVLIYICFGILNITGSYFGFKTKKKYKDFRYITFALLILFAGGLITTFFPSKLDVRFFPISSSLGIVTIIFLAYAVIIYKFSVYPVAFESISKSINDGIVVFDNFGNVIKVNSSARKMLGIKKNCTDENFEKAIVKNISNLKNSKDFKALIDKADSNQNKTVEGKIITKEPKRVLDIVITFINGKGNFIFGKIMILHDVTKKEETEKELIDSNLKLKSKQQELIKIKEELEKTNKKLIEVNKLKSEFVSIVSHDLGTPITVMQGNLELLTDETLGILNDKQKRALRLLFRNIEQLNFLRKDTLDLSQMDLGIMNLEKSNISIYYLIEMSISDLRGLANAKNQRIILNIPRKLIVYCDKNRIKQVIDNYISNAIKYTPDGGEITIIAKEEEDFIDIVVKDNGRGIPKSELENVFQRFYKVGTKVFGSTGLGLSIVKRIVETHGGKVWCESMEGKGSSFHFTLPKLINVIEDEKDNEMKIAVVAS